MAEPNDPDYQPTQSWNNRDEAPTIPATPPSSRRDSKPSTGSGKGSWEPPTPEELQPSFPQYEIREMLGRGGMGAVFKGWQKRLDRYVAIKILPPQLEDVHVNFAERFQREAKAMARFAHPGIVSVYDAGETADGLLYFVMEYIDGTDVQRMLTARRHLSPEQALTITGQVCDALDYAHRRGVIHRDIKPSNIMVDTEGRVKVTDFGLAKVATDDSAALLTGTHAYLGTPDFMAPESWLGAGKVDHRADLYAVGVMLYRMLTGHLPRGRFDPPSRQMPGLDVRFDSIIDHALQTDPGKRYSSASEIRIDLAKIHTPPIAEAQTAALETGRLPPPVPPSPLTPPVSPTPAASPPAAPSASPPAAPTPTSIPASPSRHPAQVAILIFAGILGVLFLIGVALLARDFRRKPTRPALPLVALPEKKEEPPAKESPQEPVKVKPLEPPPVVESTATVLTSPKYEWSKPENLGSGVNSSADEYALGISDDGLVLVLSSTSNGTEHLFECRRASVDQPFGKADLIDELRPGVQSCPFLTGDGNTLLYSLRPDTGATADLYQSRRTSRGDRWEKPRRIFAPGAYNSGPYLSANGLTLWFHSNRAGGRGGFDLWRSRRASLTTPFETPVNPGIAMNTEGDELSPRVSADDNALLFYRERRGTGQRIFAATLDANRVSTTQPLALPVNGRTQSPTLSADGHILYFASDMPGGRGGWDLWQIRRVAK